MGVPGLFSWIQRTFPSVAQEKTRNRKIEAAAETCDHLYIDLNHILHSCAHALGLKPDGGPLLGIFHHVERYLDWLMSVAKPQKLCLLAVDGVAPKAKLVQQRTRRFLGAYRRRLAKEIGPEVRRAMEKRAGKTFPDPPSFDQNIITPGTPFMAELTRLLHEYVDNRLNNREEWKQLKVVLSTAREPGEGEHKIMKFIRDQRQRPDYDPKTRHVVFGQDADLILLALLAHEPHFRILREVMPGIGEPPTGDLPDFSELDVAKLRQHLKFSLDPFRPLAGDSEASDNEDDRTDEGKGDTEVTGTLSPKKEALSPLQDFDFERTLEDFVFLTFLLGNDFLPAIPSIDIYDRRGGLDILMDAYKQVRAKGGGFITSAGKVDAWKFHEILKLVAEDEHDAYRRIHSARRHLKERLQNDSRPSQSSEETPSDLNAFEREGFVSVGELPAEMSIEEALLRKYRELEKREEMIGQKLESMNEDELAAEYKNRVDKRIDLKLMANCDADPMRLGWPGYEQRYYMEIRAAKYKEESSRKALEMGKAYFQGLCWSFAYYVVGPAPIATTEDSLLLQRAPGDEKSGQKKKAAAQRQHSDPSHAVWNWCYGWFYAPLIRDLAKACREAPTREVVRKGGIRRVATGLVANEGPVPPFVQLLSVLPPESAGSCLPESLARLIQATLPDSDDSFKQRRFVKQIEKLFPQDLQRRIDARGKMWPHTVVVRLPNVEYDLISHAATEVTKDEEFAEEETERNAFECADLYMRKDLCTQLRTNARAASKLTSLKGRVEWGDTEPEEQRRDPVLDLVIPAFESLFPDEGDEDEEGATICLGYDIAGIPSKMPLCALLPGAVEDEAPLRGHQFIIKPRTASAQLPNFKSPSQRNSDSKHRSGHKTRNS